MSNNRNTKNAKGYITRALEAVVGELSTQYPVLLVTGPRQVGKTTMLKHLMEGSDRSYLSLDDLETRQQARTNPRLFLEVHEPPLLIDEVQYAPELFTYIKMQVDSRGNAGDYWLTGSQVFKLMREVQESLAGRVALLGLTSLSQSELAGVENVPFTLDENSLLKRSRERQAPSTEALLNQILRGSMPKVVCDDTLNSGIFYSSYVSSYIQRDVKELSSAIDEFRFLDFLRSVAVRCAQTVNYASMARDAGIDQKTAKSWLGMLETLGLVFLLHPYSNNLLKRTVKSPKLYFFDTGLAAHMVRLRTADELRQSSFMGALFENYVIAEVAKTYQYAALEPPLYYYRDAEQREIDLIIWDKGTLYPIEVKSTAMPGVGAIKSFGALNVPTLEHGNGAVVCLAPALGSLSDNALTVPVSLI